MLGANAFGWAYFGQGYASDGEAPTPPVTVVITQRFDDRTPTGARFDQATPTPVRNPS